MLFSGGHVSSCSATPDYEHIDDSLVTKDLNFGKAVAGIPFQFLPLKLSIMGALMKI